jgi:hypothetical protein
MVLSALDIRPPPERVNNFKSSTMGSSEFLSALGGLVYCEPVGHARGVIEEFLTGVAMPRGALQRLLLLPAEDFAEGDIEVIKCAGAVAREARAVHDGERLRF